SVVGPFIKLVQAELILGLSQLRTAHRNCISQLSDESKRFIAEIWFSHFHNSYQEKNESRAFDSIDDENTARTSERDVQ
ncbi:MAG: hypothetical protein ACTHNZ_12555, partial [Trinickia sp.]